jgi:ABC-type lipoprotein release transport system permease subunit
LPGFPVAAPGVGAYAAGTLIVLASTTIAAWLPSARTAQIDPARALRVE